MGHKSGIIHLQRGQLRCQSRAWLAGRRVRGNERWGGWSRNRTTVPETL